MAPDLPTQVFIDDLRLGALPAEGKRLIGHVVLKTGRLRVSSHLLGCRLAHRHDRKAVLVVALNLAAVRWVGDRIHERLKVQ